MNTTVSAYLRKSDITCPHCGSSIEYLNRCFNYEPLMTGVTKCLNHNCRKLTYWKLQDAESSKKQDRIFLISKYDFSKIREGRNFTFTL